MLIVWRKIITTVSHCSVLFTTVVHKNIQSYVCEILAGEPWSVALVYVYSFVCFSLFSFN